MTTTPDTTEPATAFDLRSTYIHLGVDASAVPLPDFSWTDDYLAAYDERFSADGEQGRLVMMGELDASWETWERHPAGQEVVVLLSGRAELIQELDGDQRRVDLRPGQAVINPTGVWHTADVHEAGQALFITPGSGTEIRPRARR
jgi:uncharacterized cupin superfamily protein